MYESSAKMRTRACSTSTQRLKGCSRKASLEGVVLLLRNQQCSYPLSSSIVFSVFLPQNGSHLRQKAGTREGTSQGIVPAGKSYNYRFLLTKCALSWRLVAPMTFQTVFPWGDNSPHGDCPVKRFPLFSPCGFSRWLKVLLRRLQVALNFECPLPSPPVWGRTSWRHTLSRSPCFSATSPLETAPGGRIPSFCADRNGVLPEVKRWFLGAVNKRTQFLKSSFE